MYAAYQGVTAIFTGQSDISDYLTGKFPNAMEGLSNGIGYMVDTIGSGLGVEESTKRLKIMEKRAAEEEKQTAQKKAEESRQEKLLEKQNSLIEKQTDITQQAADKAQEAAEKLNKAADKTTKATEEQTKTQLEIADDAAQKDKINARKAWILMGAG